MKVNYVELAGEKRPICFSVSAAEDIAEAFGGMDAMSKGLIKGDVKSISKVLEILLEAGQKYCAAMEIDCPAPLKCRPADILDINEASEIVNSIFETIKNDTERTVEVRSKNA